MLRSSSGIREVRKEKGSAQPRWSKKLGGLRCTGQIRLGESIAVHVSQLHFLVDCLPLEGRRRGFTPRASVSSSITYRVLSLCLHLSFLYLYHLITVVIVYGLDCLSIRLLAYVHVLHIYCLTLSLNWYFCYWDLNVQGCFIHILNFHDHFFFT